MEIENGCYRMQKQAYSDYTTSMAYTSETKVRKTD